MAWLVNQEDLDVMDNEGPRATLGNLGHKAILGVMAGLESLVRLVLLVPW